MRNLAWSAFSFAAAIMLCHYVVPDAARLWLVVPFIIVGLCAFLLRGNGRRRILLLCAFSIIGIVRYDAHVKENLGLENNLQGNEYRITAYIAEYPVVYDDYSKITVHLRTDQLPRVKMVLYDYDNDVKDLEPGDMVRTTVKFTSASISSGEETDTYISKGIYLRGSVTDDLKSYETLWGKYLFFPLYLSRDVQNAFDQYLPKRAAVFMKALVTGEKNSLYDLPEIYHVMQEAGLSHVVAVSGMHLSFLVSIVLMLLGNKTGWAASILSIIVFSLMTGMSPSVLRAAFMQLLYLLAPILRRESDGITSIAFALLILLMVNPFAVASVSLQLSFAAILGIHTITPKAFEWFTEKGNKLIGLSYRCYYFAASSLSATLGASVFTVPLCAVHFGNVTILAPIANLLILWIIPLCFGLGLALCIAALLSGKLAMVIGTILSVMIEFVYAIAGSIANLQYSTIYLPESIMLFCVISIYAMIGITYFIKGHGMYKPLIPFIISIVILFSFLIGVKRYYSNGTTVAAIDVGQGQCIAILDDTNTILIDCGGAYDAGQTVVKWLSERGRQRVDCLVLTHFDKDHTNGIEDLLLQIEVDEIKYCSLNLTDYEYAILQDIQETAVTQDTALSAVNRSAQAVIGDIKLEYYIPIQPKDNNGMMVLASVGDFDMLITGDADIDTENEMMRMLPIPDGECIVVGHHGSKYSTGDRLLDRFRPEFSFISCGYNSYGHPSSEVLDRLHKRNVVIYRTDILGSVEIKVR